MEAYLGTASKNEIHSLTHSFIHSFSQSSSQSVVHILSKTIYETYADKA